MEDVKIKEKIKDGMSLTETLEKVEDKQKREALADIYTGIVAGFNMGLAHKE